MEKFKEFVLTKSGKRVELIRNFDYNPVLVIGVFHGDEPQGKFLLEKYLTQNPRTKLLLIPCLNPDGFDAKISMERSMKEYRPQK